MNDPLILTQITGFGLFFWLGLYLLLRSPQRSTITLVSIAALLAQAVFFASSAFIYTATSPMTLAWLERTFWWSAVLPMAAWFHFTNLIVRRLIDRHRQRRDWLLVRLVYGVAVVLVILGTWTNLFTNYSATVQHNDQYIDLPVGPAYGLYVAYIGVVAVAALMYLLQARRSVAHRTDVDARRVAQQLRLLLGGALLFLVGALAIAFPTSFDVKTFVIMLPAYTCLLGGLTVVGYGIAQFSMLLEGQDIKRDFFYNLTGVGLLNVVYLLLLWFTGTLSVYAVLAVVGLVTLSHSLFDWGRSTWDRLFFTRDEQAARAEARDYANVLSIDPVVPPFEPAPPATSPEPQPETQPETEPQSEPETQPTPAPAALDVADTKAFQGLVRRAITGIKSPPQLAQSPLLALGLVEQRVAQSEQPDHRLNRMAALRELLIEQIVALQPSDQEGSVVSDAWRFYNVLYYPYVRGTNRKSALAEARRLERERQRNGQTSPSEVEQVLAWLADIEEDTFYKWQRRASDTIATQLWEQNEQMRSDTVT